MAEQPKPQPKPQVAQHKCDNNCSCSPQSGQTNEKTNVTRKQRKEDTSPGWVEVSKGELPKGATVGGYMSDGEPLYIGRGMVSGCFVPGSIHPSEKLLHLAWRKKVYKLKKFQVLVYAEGLFEPLTVDDEIPIGSVSGGECDQDEDIFIGRVNHENSLIIGRISPSEGACHIPYDGQQLAFEDDFEIYTMKGELETKRK